MARRLPSLAGFVERDVGVVPVSWRTRWGAYARYDFARKRLSEERAGRVLDLACGSGYGTRFLARGSERLVVGADVSPEALAIAREQSRRKAGRLDGGRVGFIQANGEELGFGDGSFDAVVSLETIEHVGDHRKFISELGRVLRPGGLLVLSTPNKAVTSPFTRRPPNPFHVREFRLDELVKGLERAGFGVEPPYGQIFLTGRRLALRKAAAMPAVGTLLRLAARLKHGVAVVAGAVPVAGRSLRSAGSAAGGSLSRAALGGKGDRHDVLPLAEKEGFVPSVFVLVARKSGKN